jgi:hypothetical protein
LSIDYNGDLCCDYCEDVCGIDIYRTTVYKDKVFCEIKCRDDFLLLVARNLNPGQEPDVVY